MNRSYHGITRRGQGRTENQDAFFVDDELGLFVVLDGMESAAITTAALDVFTRTVAELVRGGDFDGALHAAATAAHEALRELGTGVEVAALLFGGGRAQMLWSGNCRLYRARNARVEVMTAMEWSSGICLGGESREIFLRYLVVEGGDTFVLSTDGYHRLGDDRDPLVERPDAQGFHVREPLESLTATLMGAAEDDDDATILAVRVARADPRVDLPRVVDDALDAFVERTGEDGTFLVSVTMRFAMNPPGIAEEYPRLSLVLECDPALGYEAGRATAAAFGRELEWRHPELGGPHEFRVTLGGIDDPASIGERTRRIREIAEEVVARHHGIYVGPIEPLSAPGPWQRLLVLIVRDDVDDAGDEDLAASEVRLAIEQADPELAEDVVVRGEYCK